MIVSRQNQRIKDIRRLRRCKDEALILEGPHLLAEALVSGTDIDYVLATPEFLGSSIAGDLIDPARFRVFEVEPSLLASLTDSDAPRGSLAVAAAPRRDLKALPVDAKGLYLFLDGIQDPGNLGALARTAEAFGATGLALASTTAHPNHARALRASAGSLLRLPTATDVDAEELSRYLADLAPVWAALVPRGGTPLHDLSPVRPLILAIGAEGPGLSREILEIAGELWTIPLAAPVESLNVAVAAALVLYELEARQRQELNPLSPPSPPR